MGRCAQSDTTIKMDIYSLAMLSSDTTKMDI